MLNALKSIPTFKFLVTQVSFKNRTVKRSIPSHGESTAFIERKSIGKLAEFYHGVVNTLQTTLQSLSDYSQGRPLVLAEAGFGVPFVPILAESSVKTQDKSKSLSFAEQFMKTTVLQ